MSKDVRAIDFWFCKLHFKNANLFNKLTIMDFVTYLEAGVKKPLNDGKKVWHLGGVKRATINEHEVLFGKIGKEIVDNSKTVYDDDAMDFVEKLSAEIYANYCIFIVDIKSYVIAIESQNLISLSVIKKKLIEFMPPEVREFIVFDDLSDKFNYYDRVRSWDTFTFAQFTLIPTNPDSDPEFAELDKLINNTGSDEGKLSFRASKKLSTDNSSLVMQGIAMSAAGYGTFTVAGSVNNKVDKFSNKTTKLKRTFQTDGTDIEQKVIEFNRDFKEGKNENKLLG